MTLCFLSDLGDFLDFCLASTILTGDERYGQNGIEVHTYW